MLKKGLALLILLFSEALSAHCPNHFKEEKVCVMLDQNVIFIYDEKKEHNGPYQDLKSSSLEAVKSEGIPLKFQKVARGVYRIEYAKPLRAVDLELLHEKKKMNIKVEAK
ncbi:MAG: hypothetical protein ACXVLQ_04690 [Bacteriovorax sp.]